LVIGDLCSGATIAKSEPTGSWDRAENDWAWAPPGSAAGNAAERGTAQGKKSPIGIAVIIYLRISGYLMALKPTARLVAVGSIPAHWKFG
jgi:hypothetical protein